MIENDRQTLIEEYIKDAHARGHKVFAWVLNNKEAIAKAKAKGVDGIMSDPKLTLSRTDKWC